MTVEDLFHQYSLGKTIDYKSLDEDIIKQLVDTIINDKNSSTARELAILKEANYKHLEGKLNYDGFNDNEFVEVKLRNLDTSNPRSKLNGEGNYTDYTWERFKHHSEDNPTMLVGGFINGRMIYIFKFKYLSKGFLNRITERLTSFFGDITSVRKPNTFLRSLGFNYSHYKDDAELIYVAPKEVLENNKQYINKELYKRLWSVTQVGEEGGLLNR